MSQLADFLETHKQIDRNDRSVGLGLYIVDSIVRAHGGSVRVQSGETGTTFTVHLPRR
jgi:sigma-B regulation protein RsbU (phosphoserine phosphatase)